MRHSSGQNRIDGGDHKTPLDRSHVQAQRRQPRRLPRRNPHGYHRRSPTKPDPRPHALAIPKRVNPKSLGDHQSAYTGCHMQARRNNCDVLITEFYGRRLVEMSTARSRNALPTTLTDDNAIAAAAMIGDSSNPNTGYSTPAAIGIPAAL